MTSPAPVLHFDPKSSAGLYVDLEKLVVSRLLIQGSSGAGKSFMLRYILEQTHGKIQQFVFDPEGEFSTLRERFDYVVASAGGDGDVLAHPDSADLLCRQLVDLEVSAILDLYELDPYDRAEFVARFLNRLINMPRDTWRPALVVVDEAHEFAPQNEPVPSRRPMELIVSKGRKRGLCAVYSTQRLSKLSKNAADLQNILIGYTGLDVDVKRAADILGFDKAQSGKLKRLEHEFLAFGPALTREVMTVRSGQIQTRHPKPGELLPPMPPPEGKLARLIEELAQIPERAAEEERTLEALEARARELESKLAEAVAQQGGPSLAQVDEAVAAAVELAVRETEQAMRGQFEDLANERARAAVDQIREEVREPLSVLHHVLANGKALAIPETPAPRAPERPPRETIHAKREPIARPRETMARPRETKAASRETTGVRATIGSTPRKMIDAMAALYALGVKVPSRENVSGWLGISASTGTFKNYLSELRGAGLIEDREQLRIALTQAGHDAAERPRVPDLETLHGIWMRKLGSTTARMLQELINDYPDAIGREELGARLGISHTTGTFKNYLSELRSPGLIRDVSKGGPVVATELLFPPGLR